MGETSLLVPTKQLSSTGFQQLSVLNTGGANRLACAAAKAPIDMEFEGGRICGEFIFLNRAHQVDTASRAVVLVTSQDIGGTGFQTETAMHTGKELLFFSCECCCELG